MKRNLVFLMLAIILLTPWPVAYAYDNDMAEQAPIQIEAASASVAPSWHAYGSAIGGVSAPGDLFYIDAADSAIDTLVTLHITNADELVVAYKGEGKITFHESEKDAKAGKKVVKQKKPKKLKKR